MIIFSLRSDNPQAEIAIHNGAILIARHTWEAHRQLAETLHSKIEQLFTEANVSWDTIGGITVYEGPGSFTGLRIGMSVANALAASYQIPIVATGGDDWILRGYEQLRQGIINTAVVPEYGFAPNITIQKK